MKILKQGFYAVLLLLFAGCILFLPETTTDAIKDALQVCSMSVLPSLFPFFVFSNMWISLGYAQKMSKLAAPLMKRLFHLPGAAASALTLGLIGGYPTGAQTVAGLYQKKLISKDEAERTLLFTNNSGPAFAVAVIGGQLFHSAAVGILVYLVHILSAFLIGLLFRSSAPGNSQIVSEETASPFLPALTESIRKAGQTTIQVCVFISVFSIFSAIIKALVPLSLQSSDVFRLLIGSLEMVAGASGATGWSLPFSVCAAAFYLGWGGMCIHCQTLSILEDTDIKTGKYFIGKFLHGIFSFLLTGCFLRFLPDIRPAWFSERSWTPSLCQICCLIVTSVMLIWFLKKTSGNRSKERV